ncbi:MAG: hypothetical protein IIV64_02675, partial [Muribaculaceae bacterium]|nr:hypothetical protein [Muribaculaceae bacterium]
MKRIVLGGLISLVSLSSMAQWTSDVDKNTDVGNPRNRIYVWNYGINPDNSISTAFLSPNVEQGRIELWYNIHDKEGKSIFADGAQLAGSNPTLMFTLHNALSYHDAQGNMIMIYQSKRNAQECGVEGDRLNYDVYKVSPTGEMLWDEPVDLNRGGYSEDTQGAVTVAGLEDGSYIFAYADYFSVDGSLTCRICLERVSADGEMLWDETMYIEDKTIMYTYPYLVSAGDNQVILLYAKGSNQDLMLRKIDFDGTSVWPEDVKVYRGGFPAIPIWTFIGIKPDGEGGAFVTWRDDRYFTNYESSYVSHILSDGSYAYSSGLEGEAVGYSEGLRSFEPTVLYDNKTQSLYTLRRETNMGQSYQRLMLQKMADTGELLWGREGVEMRESDGALVAYFDLEFAEDGNVVAFYMVQHDGVDVAGYAHKFNAETGEPMWEEDIRLTPNVGSRSEMQVSQLI